METPYPNDLREIIRAIKLHDKIYSDHGTGCACMDQYAWALRRIFEEEGLTETATVPDFPGSDDEPAEPGYTFTRKTKSFYNLMTILGYIK